MNRSRGIILKIAKPVVAALAILNLIALFIFGYEPPAFLASALHLSTGDGTSGSAPTLLATEGDSWEILFPTESLDYDGTEELNLTADVTVVDATGAVQTHAEVTATLASGEAINQKRIEYSSFTASGKSIAAIRTLQLPGSYQGPVITQNGDIPSHTAAELQEDFIQVLLSDGVLYAEDGFGNDITDQLTLVHTSDTDEEGNISAILSVSNQFSDSTTITITIPLRAEEEIQ